MEDRLRSMTICVLTVLMSLFLLTCQAQNQETCNTVATEQYLCWENNDPMDISLTCNVDHMIVVDSIRYMVSDNSCPQQNQESQSSQTAHCYLHNVTRDTQINCDDKRTCVQRVNKRDATSECSVHSGAHYLDVRYYCIPDFGQVHSAREVSMCDTGEWSGSYAHILSHQEANSGSFTTDIGCHCKIKRNKGTELEIKMTKFITKNTNLPNGDCSQFVRILQTGGAASIHACRANKIYWKLGCDTLHDIEIWFQNHEVNKGVNFKISVQAAGDRSFSLLCGIPSLQAPFTTTPSQPTSSPMASPTQGQTVQVETPAGLFGLPMWAGVSILVVAAVIMIVIVVLAVFFAIRARRKQKASNYRDLAEEHNHVSNGRLPARPPEGGYSPSALPGVGEVRMSDITTNQKAKKGISNGGYSDTALPGVGEVRMSDITTNQKAKKGMSNGGFSGTALPGSGEVYSSDSKTKQMSKNGVSNGWANYGSPLSEVGELQTSGNSTYQSYGGGPYQNPGYAGLPADQQKGSATYGRFGPKADLPDVGEVQLGGSATKKGSLYS